MAKAKNKGKEPKQNENKAVEELDEKIKGSSVDTEETEEETAEETGEEASEEETEEASAEIADEESEQHRPRWHDEEG